MYPQANEIIIVELQKLAVSHGGILRPEIVVEAARPKSSPIHKYFMWNDNEAARRYRLQQARGLIGAVVRYVQLNSDKRPIRVFVSLGPDRRAGGGYRDTVAVFSNRDMRDQMLQDALEDLRRFEMKYSSLKELTDVFVASKKVRTRLLEIMAA